MLKIYKISSESEMEESEIIPYADQVVLSQERYAMLCEAERKLEILKRIEIPQLPRAKAKIGKETFADD